MAITALGTELMINPPAPYAAVPAFVARTLRNRNIFTYWFNTYDGEGSSNAAVRTSINAVLGSSKEESARQWFDDNRPQFFPHFARFRNDCRLITNVMLPPRGSIFALCRTIDTSIGTAGDKRAFICGTYGSQLERGLGFEFSNWATGQFRAYTFDVDTPTLPVMCTEATGTTDLNKWRILYCGWDENEIEIADLTGGSGTDPDPVPLVDGHSIGTRPFTIGGRGTLGDNYAADVTKDISFIMGFDARPTVGQKTILKQQVEAVVAETDLLLLDTAP